VNMNRSPVITLTDRLRFFYAYLDENPDLVSFKKDWIKKVLRKTHIRLIGKGRWVKK